MGKKERKSVEKGNWINWQISLPLRSKSVGHEPLSPRPLRGTQYFSNLPKWGLVDSQGDLLHRIGITWRLLSTEERNNNSHPGWACRLVLVITVAPGRRYGDPHSTHDSRQLWAKPCGWWQAEPAVTEDRPVPMAHWPPYLEMTPLPAT